MKTFLVLLSDKQPHLLNDNLLKTHIDFLKQLHARKQLLVCGPFVDNNGAVLIVQADSIKQAEEIIQQDPFLSKNYYKKYIIHEFMAAGENNNWLSDAPQTNNNLQK